MNECLNPVWNQTFDFVVEDGLHDMLTLELWDHDTFGKVPFFLCNYLVHYTSKTNCQKFFTLKKKIKENKSFFFVYTCIEECTYIEIKLNSDEGSYGFKMLSYPCL